MLPTSLNQVRNLLSSGTPFVAIKKFDRLKAGECMPLCAMMACQRDAKRGELVLHILNDRDSRLKSLAFWNLSRDGTHDEPMYTIFFPAGRVVGNANGLLQLLPPSHPRLFRLNGSRGENREEANDGWFHKR